MIEKMKKFTFLVTDKEYEGFISSLRQQGVVHVQQLQQGASCLIISLNHYKLDLKLIIQLQVQMVNL